MHTEQDTAGFPPFHGAPDPEIFFPGAEREAICQALILDILNGKRFLYLGGEAGSGKTQICQVIMARLPGDITPVYLDEPTGSFDDVLRHAALDLGAVRGARADDFSWPEEFDRQLLLRQGEGGKVLLILDQAERLFGATLERLLVRIRREDSPPFGILLAAGGALDAPLAQLARLGPDYTPDSRHVLPPLDAAATEQYLRYRLRAAGIDWSEHEALLGKKRLARIFRQARGNIGETNAAAAEILDMKAAPPPSSGAAKTAVPDRQLPLWGAVETTEAAEARRPPEAVPPAKEAVVFAAEPEPGLEPAAAAPAEPAAGIPDDAPDVAERAEPVALDEEPHPFRHVAPRDAATAPEADAGTADDEEEEDEGPGLGERLGELTAALTGGLSAGLRRFLNGLAAGSSAALRSGRRALAALERGVAPPVIALYEKLWGDKKLLGGALGTALLFCVLGLALGTEDRPAVEPAPTAEPAAPEPPAAALPPSPATPDGADLLTERLAAGKALVAASYRGAGTIRLLVVSGDRAERELAALLASPPFRHAAANLYVVRKPVTPPAYFVFYGIFDNEEQARQARNNLPVDLRAHHPYPLSVSEALRLDDGA